MLTIVDQRRSTIDQLEQTLVEGELMIGAIRAAQAAALAELGEARIDKVDGTRTLDEWVAARLDVAGDTARALVEASRLLPEHAASALQLAAAEVGRGRPRYLPVSTRPTPRAG
jgi:hypothetical protein